MRTLFSLLSLSTLILGLAGCLTTSTSVEVRSIEEFPGGQIPDRRALTKAVNTGEGGTAVAEANGNAAASATNTGDGGLATAISDGYSKNNPNDPGDPRDKIGGDGDSGTLTGVKPTERLTFRPDDSQYALGDWDKSGRGLGVSTPSFKETK